VKVKVMDFLVFCVLFGERGIKAINGAFLASLWCTLDPFWDGFWQLGKMATKLDRTTGPDRPERSRTGPSELFLGFRLFLFCFVSNLLKGYFVTGFLSSSWRF
jgi:hypothetical protein